MEATAKEPAKRSELSSLPPSVLAIVMNFVDGTGVSKLYGCGLRHLNTNLTRRGGVLTFHVDFFTVPAKLRFPKILHRFTTLETLIIKSYEPIPGWQWNKIPVGLKHLSLDFCDRRVSYVNTRDVLDVLALLPQLQTVDIPSVFPTVPRQQVPRSVSSLQTLVLHSNSPIESFQQLPPNLTSLEWGDRYNPAPLPTNMSAILAKLPLIRLRIRGDSIFRSIQLTPSSVTDLSLIGPKLFRTARETISEEDRATLEKLPPNLLSLEISLYDLRSTVTGILPRSLQTLKIDTSANHRLHFIDLDSIKALPSSLTKIYAPNPEADDLGKLSSTLPRDLLASLPKSLTSMPFWLSNLACADRKLLVEQFPDLRHLALLPPTAEPLSILPRSLISLQLEPGLREFSANDALPRSLVQLILTDCLSTSILALLPGLPNLTHLELKGGKDIPLNILPGTLPASLTHLELRFPIIRRAKARTTEPNVFFPFVVDGTILSTLKCLRHLSLEYSGDAPSNAFYAALPQALDTLEISNDCVVMDTIMQLTHLKQLTTLSLPRVVGTFTAMHVMALPPNLLLLYLMRLDYSGVSEEPAAWSDVAPFAETLWPRYLRHKALPMSRSDELLIT